MIFLEILSPIKFLMGGMSPPSIRNPGASPPTKIPYLRPWGCFHIWEPKARDFPKFLDFWKNLFNDNALDIKPTKISG